MNYNKLVQEANAKEPFTDSTTSTDINMLNEEINKQMSIALENNSINHLTEERTSNNLPACSNRDNSNPSACAWKNPGLERFDEAELTVIKDFKDFLKSYELETLKSFNLAVTFVAAMAWNDAVKYFIGRSIKMKSGSPLYYLYYALGVTLIAVLVEKFVN